MEKNQEQKSASFYSLKGLRKPLRSLRYDVKKIFNPHYFQGNRRKDKYFEGWYFKNVSADEGNCWSFIPGVSLVNGDDHAFVQVINGQTGDTFYYRYAAGSFSFSPDTFAVQIADNFFSAEKIVLNLDDGINHFSGELEFENTKGFPANLQRPGIMGWYRYVPFMECYHGVVSLDHSLQGQLQYNENRLDFSGGRGYIEKDWGSSMPEAWVWMQTNHFEQPGTSFMLSVARIPWIGKTFTGFLGFFLHNNHLISFATYTGARIHSLEYTDREIVLHIEGKKYDFHIHGIKALHSDSRKGKGSLKAPMLGNMDRTIHESIDAEIIVQVKDKSGNSVFQGKGRNAGLEFVDDLDLLKP